MTPTTLDALLEDARAGKGDPATFLILADFLDQLDPPDPDLAHCFRWMGRRAKYPAERLRYRPGRHPSGGAVVPGSAVPETYRWAWYPDKGSRDVVPVPEHAVVPRLLFLALRKSPDHAFYGAWEQAIDALSDALVRVRRLYETGEGGP